MELVGKAVKEKELSGRESLTELVDKFRGKKALIRDGNIPALNKEFKIEIRNYQNNLQKTMSKILSDIPLDSEFDRFEKSLDHLLEEYIYSEFGINYDEISEELFNLKRIIPYKKDREDIKITIPLFASVDLGSSKNWIFKEQINIGEGYNRKTYDIELNSERPPITKEAKEKSRIARSNYMKILSNVLRERVVGDWLNRKEYLENFDMKVYWIPKQSELALKISIIDKDPILIAHLYDKNYLVAKWNVDGEIPYEHYIREFSSGILKKI